MKNVWFIFFFLFAFSSFAQQTETFDLATYTIPKGWKKTSSTADIVGYSITNNQKGTYGQIAIYASTNSKGSLQEDFESEWQELVVKIYKPSQKPELLPSVSENGWDAQGGVAPFEFSGAQSVAMLLTMSGYGKCMSIVVLTNTEDYKSQMEKFLESVSLKKLETTTQPVVDINNTASIVGTWGKSASPNQKYDDYNGGNQKDQYTFNQNGTYAYFSKTFSMRFDKILLVRETGSYQINGNNLTINPQKSIIEAWSKKDGTDKWGKLLTTQNRSLEKITYQFTKHFFSGIQQWNLVLQSENVTQRDGPFSSNTTFNKAWYYLPLSSTNPPIDLPGTEIIQKPAKEVSQPVATGGYHFTTSNFDDGWTSTAQEDWVMVVKKSVKVLIHYPNKKADAYNGDVVEGLKNAWDVLVAPRYSTATNFEFKPVHGWQTIEFAEADVVENATRKNVHVVLFKMNYSGGTGRYMEFITPDKKTFEDEFGAYHESTSGWEKMESMLNYNKFAVAASDLKGKWTNDFSGALQYVNAYTGASAGMNTHASNEKFEFGPGSSYKWDIGVASGFVGNIKFQSAKSTGVFSVPNNWQVSFSDLEGKPKTYNAFFSCVKGSRILWLGDTGYGKVE